MNFVIKMFFLGICLFFAFKSKKGEESEQIVNQRSVLLKSFFKSTLHIMQISYFIVKLMKKENPCTLMKRYQWLEARTQDFCQGGGARFFRN